VVEATGRFARVRTARTEACANCAAQALCHPFQTSYVEVIVENTIGARPGEQVLLVMRPSSVLAASCLLYLVPLAFLLTAAVCGYYVSRLLSFLTPNAGVLLGAGLGLTAAFFVTKKLARRLERRQRFVPTIARPEDSGLR